MRNLSVIQTQLFENTEESSIFFIVGFPGVLQH